MLSLDTEVLTVAGWRNRWGVRAGLPILCYWINDHAFEFLPVIKAEHRPYSGIACWLHSRRFVSQLVSGDQRCLVSSSDETDSRLVYSLAQELPKHIKVPIVIKPRPSHSGYRWAPVKARVTSIPYVGAMWCATVPAGALVARHRLQMFITGSSQVLQSPGYDSLS